MYNLIIIIHSSYLREVCVLIFKPFVNIMYDQLKTNKLKLSCLKYLIMFRWMENTTKKCKNNEFMHFYQELIQSKVSPRGVKNFTV